MQRPARASFARSPSRARSAALGSLAILALVAGCRSTGGGGTRIDPQRPDQLAPCPAGAPHLNVALRAPSTDLEQALVRYTRELAPCQGALVPDSAYGSFTSVAGFADGTDLLGFSDSFGYGGRVVRLDGSTEVGRIEDEEHHPMAIAPLTFRGQPAAAVVWGTGSSDSGERLDVYAESDLSRLGTWEISYELVRVAAPVSGQADRLAGIINDGLQEYRADPGATTLATTGELQVAAPNGVGYVRSVHVYGEHVRASTNDGVLSWRRGIAPAFLGPVHCQWPDTLDTPLPREDARYIAAVVDLRSPEDSLALIEGELDAGGDPLDHLFVVRRRGECRRVLSVQRGYDAVAIGWSAAVP